MTSVQRPPRYPGLPQTPELPCMAPPVAPDSPAPALLRPHSAHSSPHQSLLSLHPYPHWHFMKLLRASLVVQQVKKMKSLSRVRLFVTPWTVAHQASQSMGFSRQEYWSGLPFSSPGDLPDPGIESGSPALLADSLPSEPQRRPSIAKNK